MKDQIIEKIQQEKIIAIMRGIEPERCLRVAEALYKGGIRLIEITYNQKDPASFPAVAEAIAAVAKAYGDDMPAGAGTVVSKELVELTAQADGRFIVSPDVNTSVIRRTRQLDMVSIPGAMTPTEIMTAHRAGADFVKLFPAASLGTDYIKAILAPINHVKLLATGGVSEANAADFLRLGMAGAGIGGALTNQAWIAAGEYEKITQTAQRLVNAVKNA